MASSENSEVRSRRCHPSGQSDLDRWNEAGAIFGVPPDTLDELLWIVLCLGATP